MISSIRHASDDGRPLPIPNPTTKPYFDAASRRELVLPHCPRDGFFFYPRTRCPHCLGDDWEWQRASGLGKLHSFTIDRIGHDPALAHKAPFAIGIVELDEGPRMTANIVDCKLEDLAIDMPLEVCFEAVDGHTLVNFRPRGGA